MSYGKLLLQVFFILVIACSMGIGVNALRKDGLPLLVKANSSKKLGFSVDISFAKKMFYENNAIFIDARPKEFYNKLHIKGAINITPEQIEKVTLPKDKIIITYCDNQMCELSKELALELYSLGFDKVYYLKDGLDSWVSHNLPTEKEK